MTNQPFKLLIIEDNPADVRLVKETFANDDSDLIEIKSVNDGSDALDYLHRRGKYKDVEKPNLVLLDLNMPRVSGFDILADIKESADSARIPVIVFTSSQNPSDIARSYDLKANAYVVKPVSLDTFLSIMESIKIFWTQYVKVDKT